MITNRTHIRTPVPLGNDLKAWVELPRDVTAAEAARVAHVIAAFGVPDVDVREADDE